MASPGSITADIDVVGPRYLAMLDVPVLQGREFTTSNRNGVPVALVNQRILDLLFDRAAPYFWRSTS